jgi:hypothetical protein
LSFHHIFPFVFGLFLAAARFVEYAMATACFGGLPAAISLHSSGMLFWM